MAFGKNHSLDDLVEQVWRPNLLAEARKILLTRPMGIAYKEALARIPSIHSAFVGGGRAFPKLGHVEAYTEFRNNTYSWLNAVMPDCKEDVPKKIVWENSKKKIFSNKMYQCCSKAITDVFTRKPGTNNDFDVVAQTVDNKMKNHKKEISGEVYSELVDVLSKTPDLIKQISMAYNIPVEDVLTEDEMNRRWDFRSGIQTESEFLESLKYCVAIQQCFPWNTQNPSGIKTYELKGNKILVRANNIGVKVVAIDTPKNPESKRSACIRIEPVYDHTTRYLAESLENGMFVLYENDMNTLTSNMLSSLPNVRSFQEMLGIHEDYAKKIAPLDTDKTLFDVIKQYEVALG